MQTFEEWLNENHPEAMDENWRQTMGALAMAGASFLPMANAQAAEKPNAPNAAQSTTLDQQLQGKYPKMGGGRTDNIGEADQSKFTTRDLINLARDKNGVAAMASQVAQVRLAREHGIELDRMGFATLTDNAGTIKVKVHPVLTIEKGFVNARTDEGKDVRLPLTWLSPASQQLVTRIVNASK